MATGSEELRTITFCSFVVELATGSEEPRTITFCSLVGYMDAEHPTGRMRRSRRKIQDGAEKWGHEHGSDPRCILRKTLQPGEAMGHVARSYDGCRRFTLRRFPTYRLMSKFYSQRWNNGCCRDCSLADLIEAGFSATDQKAAGSSLADLKAGFSLADMKVAGFSATDPKAADISLADLKAAAFSLADLKVASATSSILMLRTSALPV